MICLTNNKLSCQFSVTNLDNQFKNLYVSIFIADLCFIQHQNTQTIVNCSDNIQQ